jgi:hypothetical protein
MSSTYTPKELNRGAPQPSPSSSISASAAAHHRRFLRRCSLSVLSEHLHDLLYEPSLYSPFFPSSRTRSAVETRSPLASCHRAPPLSFFFSFVC